MAKQALLAKIASDPYLSTLPAIAMRVIQKTSQPDCTLAQVAGLVGQDPALCAKVLKLVNSAFFHLPRTITSINRALQLLGIRRVRSLILSLSLPSFQRRTTSHPWMCNYWKASVAAAIAAHEWAKSNRSSDPDDDLVYSLLCDLGTLILLEMYPDQYAKVLALSPRAFIREQCNLERELFGFDHAELGAYLLESWGMPEEMTEAIRYHHQPDNTSVSGRVADRVQVLAFASKIGQLQLAPDQPDLFMELIDFARDRFQLDQEDFVAFLEPLQEKVEQLAVLLNVDIGKFHHYPLLLANAAGQLAQLASETALDNIRVSEEKDKAESECLRGAEALERLGRTHELILNAAGEGIYGLDLGGEIIFANVAAARMLRWQTEELIGVSASTLFATPTPDPQPPALDPLRTVFTQGKVCHVEDGTFRRKDGTNFPISYTCAPIREKERVVGAVVTFRDMTDQRKLEEEARQLRKMEAIGRLAGGVAHDFNNLLTVILGCGELLMIPGVLEERPHRLVAEITKAGQQAADLTRQLLAFSRQQVLAPKVIHLNEVVKDVEKLLRRLIGADIALTSELAPNLGKVKADPSQLEQVILNLAVNARDAMPAGGRLSFETSNVDLREVTSNQHLAVPPGYYAMLTVTDTGSGMDEATQSRIFEPFFTTKGLGKGTGLGLATVYGIVKQSGGVLSVYSKVGIGTCFKVYFPLVDEPLTPRQPISDTRPRPVGKETVLVVEDQESVRALIRHVLGEGGYTVLEAGDGSEAMDICERYPSEIQLLLTDVVLPETSATALAEAVLLRHPTAKVLFMSGYTDDEIMDHHISAMSSSFLQKPFTPTTLARKVRDVLDQTPVGCELEVASG